MSSLHASVSVSRQHNILRVSGSNHGNIAVLCDKALSVLLVILFDSYEN